MAEALALGSTGVSRRRVSPQSGVDTFETQVGAAEATIELFDTNTGPFPPGTIQNILTIRVRNSGGAAEQIFMSLDRIDNQGNIIEVMCTSLTNVDVEPGNCATLANATTDPGGTCHSRANSVCSSNTFGNLHVRVSDTPGTTERWGFSTWSLDENAPPYPSVQEQQENQSGDDPVGQFLDSPEVQDIAIPIVVGVASGVGSSVISRELM